MRGRVLRHVIAPEDKLERARTVLMKTGSELLLPLEDLARKAEIAAASAADILLQKKKIEKNCSDNFTSKLWRSMFRPRPHVSGYF